MNRESFEKLVQEALDRIPAEFQEAMRNVAIVIEDCPSEDGLYGLYHGIPLPERTADDSGTTPDVIFLYQKALEEDFRDREELIREIEITVVHEIAHYFGFDEGTLVRYGYD